MNIHKLSNEEVLRGLVTSVKGLSEYEASKRLHEYGLNEIKEVRRKPLYQKFLAQFVHFLAVLLWMAAGLCFLSEYLHPGEGLLSLGISIIGVIFINAVFTFVQEYRTEKAIEALRKLLPFNVKILREGTIKEVRSENVVPGDVLCLSEGDKVPADARLIESSGLMVNNALLTGESDAKPRNHEPFAGDYPESSNIVFAGTLVVSGNGRAVTFATGMSTEFGKIAHLTGGVQERLSTLQKEITRVTKIVAVIAGITGIFFFTLGFLIGKGFWHNFLFAIGIIIANVPEGLLPTVTLSLAMGSQRMARKKALIKTLTAVETLGSVTVICTDKTGTLTQNKMEVKEAWTLDIEGSEERRQEIGYSGEGAENASALMAKGGAVSYRMLMTIAALCNNATFEKGKYKGDPTEAAILKASRDTLGTITSERIIEIPFDSRRKRMTTVCKVSKDQGVKRTEWESDSSPEPSSSQPPKPFQLFSFTKGALETILPLCSNILADSDTRTITDDDKKSIIQVYYSMMDKGLRVIAFAYKEVGTDDSNVISRSDNNRAISKNMIALPSARNDNSTMFAQQKNLESNLTFVGLMGLADPPRPEVPDAIEKCHGAGIKIIMITGDAGRTSLAVARQIGLVKNDPGIIEGDEINLMTDRELREKLLLKEIIFARMTPVHKMRIVTILEDEGERVAVTGDGVNDAPALKKANIGIAMGMMGTDVAREAADMVLLDDNFASIVSAIEEGRAIFENIRKFVSYIFASNIPEIVPYIAYVIFRIPLPLTIMQILAVDLGTDMFPALALGAEKPTKDVMKQLPRSPDERLLNFKVFSRAYLFLGPIEAVAGLFGFFYVLGAGGWKWGTVLSADNFLYMQATTACLAGIVISQIGNVFACRSFNESVFSIGLFSNRLILFGIAVELILSVFIIYHPMGNKIFGTAPLDLHVWLILIPFGIGLLMAEESRKLYIRSFR